MALSMYQASVPALQRTLKALDAILDKAAANAAEKIDPSCLLGTPLPRYVQLRPAGAACVRLRQGRPARLAGVPCRVSPDTEKTFPELKARIHKTLDSSPLEPEQIDGSEGRDITIKAGPSEMTFQGQDYLLHLALPNFYFHARPPTTSCATTAWRSANSISWAGLNGDFGPPAAGILDLP